MDEQQRLRLQDDLLGFFEGDLHFDSVTRVLYSTDASIFQVSPAGVAIPKHEDDIRNLVRYCHENGVSLTARGAGTGIAGESLGSGVILDLSRNFRNIVDISAETVRVQPGVVYSHLQRELAKVGRRFAPDPSTGTVCTLGGMLANNSSGAHTLKHGYTRNHVESLRVILDTGEIHEIGDEPIPTPTTEQPSHLHDILTALAVTLEHHRDLLDLPRTKTPYDRCGYCLDGILHDGRLDLRRLLVGSEGTLALFTEATLRTLPLPGGRSLVLLGFGSLEDALRTVQDVLPIEPAACELLDRRFLGLVRARETGVAAKRIPPNSEAVLLVEFETDTPSEARHRAEKLVHVLRGRPIHHHIAVDLAEHEQLWQLRELALPSLYGLKGRPQPVPLIEDIAVPVELLHDFLRRVQEILHEQEITASFLVHAGTGQVHTRPFLELSHGGEMGRLWDLAEKVHTLAIEMGGTVSTQHGVGLARTPWVARQVGPLYPVFRQVKAIFDPKNILNPGKIVALESSPPQLMTKPWRETNPEPERLSLRWVGSEMITETNHCNGCGTCRTELTPTRMCPIFRADNQEAATPRAKANILRSLLLQAEEDKPLASDALRRVADLCVHCKMCAKECPARVNVPKLMVEAKAANVAEHGLRRSDWFFSNLEGLLQWGSAYSVLANLTLGSRSFRWLLEKMYGLSSQRRLPRFAPHSFMSIAKRRNWTRRPHSGKPVVAYFVDVFANYIDPQVAEACVLVLQHQGFDVFVPEQQRSSGIEAFVAGDVERARELARQNLVALADLAREGIAIVCSEPSASLMLQQEYLDLLEDLDAGLVAKETWEFTQFLGHLADQGTLKTDFHPLDFGLGHHVPCHIKALPGEPRGSEILQKIPSLRVETLDLGCSGMAGTFGLRRENLHTSLAAGRTMLAAFDRPRSIFGVTECSACRMQMEHAARKRTLHPAQYLAYAYGLMPEIEDRLRLPLRAGERLA